MDKIAQALTGLSRRRFLSAVGTAAAGYMLPWPAWCADAVMDGGAFVVALSNEPATLNPMLSQALPTFLTCNQIYDTLVKYNEKFEPIPWLAKSWKVAPDGKTFEFELN